MDTEINWRHMIEHAKDPFYEGDVYKIIKLLDVDKMVVFINEICNVINARSSLTRKTIPSITMNYSSVSTEERMGLIQALNEINTKIFEKITEMSHMSMERQLNYEEVNIIDIGFKYQELQKYLYYIYINDKKILKNYSGLKCDDFSYFTRMAVMIAYQICDKLGVYLDNVHNLSLDKKYFKNVVEEINNRNLHDLLTNSICRLRDSDEYNELNKIRQSIAHGKKILIFKPMQTL